MATLTGTLYGVTTADVAAELGSMFGDDFSATTRPTVDTVRRWIADYDLRVRLFVQKVKPPPAATDAAVPLARSWIRLMTAASVVRSATAGYDPAAIAQAAAAYTADAKNAWATLEELGVQISGAEVAPSSSVLFEISDREMVIDDDDLNPRLRGRF